MSNKPKAIELFLAATVATAITVVSTTATQSSEEINQGNSIIAHTHAQGGEGGEGGEGGVTNSNPDVSYMTTLGLMKGHLIVAQELIAEGNYEQAEPHIGHPVEELYSEIETELSARNVADFKPTLNQLHDLSKSAPESPEMEALFTESLNSVDEAIAAIPEEQLQSPEFIMEVIVGMLQTAAAEYEAAIANNQIVEIIEYQDSRGFVLYSEQLYQNIANQMSQERPDDHKIITDSFTQLKTVWPSVNPPETPIKSPSEVYSLVATIELHK